MVALFLTTVVFTLGGATSGTQTASHVDIKSVGLTARPSSSHAHSILKVIPPVKLREDIGSVLESEQMHIGVELGVRRGEYASQILSRWKQCRRYVLVDLWASQNNYKDTVNHEDHDQNMNTALAAVKEFENKIEVCQNFTSSCASNFPDNYFDFVYIDARHDYKGVLEDLHAWWPKLKIGGIYGGHDYVTNDDGPIQTGQDWSLNYDGTVDETGRAVKGAVDDFSMYVNRQIVVTYREPGWNSWFFRK